MSDIFSRASSSLAGVFTSDRAKLALKGNLGVLVQQMQIAYSQSITRLFEIGNQAANGGANIYYVGGRTEGQLSIGRVVGPSGSISAMYEQYGDVCKARGNDISLSLIETDCSINGQGAQAVAPTPVRFLLKFCVINSVQFSLAARDMIISENISMMLGSLETVNF